MKKLYKRLPCLLLALAIAVMPLLLAVSANASSGVLTDCSGSSAGIYLDGLYYPLPDFDFNFFFCFVSASDGALFFYFGVDVPVTSVYRSSYGAYTYVTFDLSSDYFCDTYSYNNGEWVSQGRSMLDGQKAEFSQTPMFLYGVDSSLISSDVLSLFSPVEVVFDSSSGPGIFSVFSGVASWLAGAVNNMVTMFWTAEGGLSVLGVLAVASLAIAFIVLLTYLLAGWMKFK